jgi:hypothetical protein
MGTGRTTTRQESPKQRKAHAWADTVDPARFPLCRSAETAAPLLTTSLFDGCVPYKASENRALGLLHLWLGEHVRIEKIAV